MYAGLNHGTGGRRGRVALGQGGEVSAKKIGAAGLVALSVLSGCGGSTEAERFYPLAEGRSWSYVMTFRNGTEPDARTIETHSKVTNLASQRFDGQSVTPQRNEAMGGAQVRLIRASSEGIAEVATQSDPTATPVPRVPPNGVLRTPLQVGNAWQATWQSSQFAQTTLLPMTKTVSRTDGTITLPAGEFANCLVLSIKGQGPVRAPEGPVEVTVEGEEWFAPDVGMIRGSFREEVDGRPENATRVDLDLAEFSR